MEYAYELGFYKTDFHIVVVKTETELPKPVLIFVVSISFKALFFGSKRLTFV